MSRELFQDLEPKRSGGGWRALPASLALHALAGIAIAALVVRPVASAIEEHRAGVLRFPSVEATPAPVAVPAAPPFRAKAGPSVAPPVPTLASAPAPAPIPVDDSDLEEPAPGEHDDTPSGCLTGCGDGPPDNAGTGGGMGDGPSSVDTATGGGWPLPIGGALRAPRKTHQVLPEYPELARRAGVGAVVIVQCVIDVHGRVSDARVLRGHPLLDSSALEAVRQWRYEPTRLNGIAVPVVMTVTVTFQPRR